ncbi:MAG TPA: EAL domain-containing response regulator [Pedomonas sp.]|uniref:EAL domain-containing response regulator n=1 Tax=Pedomonas sp. TaxID=2976421 RepID=UPI002F3F9EAD
MGWFPHESKAIDMTGAPSSNGANPASPEAALLQPKARQQSHRILIVDDDPDICEEISSLLSDLGHEVRTLTDPHLLESMPGFQPEIMILDLGMPTRDGFQIIDTLPAHFPKTQLIIASGHDARILNAAARRAQSRGIHVLGTLRKPYTPGTLLQLLHVYAPDRPAAPPPPRPGASPPAVLLTDLLDPGNLEPSIAVAYQEKRDLLTEEVRGYEALLRSRVPGYANPELFFQHNIPLDLQIAITRVIIHNVLLTACSLQGGEDRRLISVNCTPDILVHPAFMQGVEQLLADRPDVIETLSIEITEHNTLESADDIIAAAGRLSVRGFQIALDDFGIGINNFDSLLNLHCEEVKMDKKIFWQFFADRSSDSIAREVINFCHASGVRVTIEGIETQEHRAYAAELGADYGQGFLWGRPAILPPPGRPTA